MAAAAAAHPMSVRNDTNDTSKLQLFQYRQKKTVSRRNMPQFLEKLAVEEKCQFSMPFVIQ